MDSLTKIWDQVLEDFRINRDIDDVSFNNIFKELTLVSLEKNTATVTAAHEFYITIARQYIEDFESLLNRYTDHVYHVNIIHEDDLVVPEESETKKVQIKDNLIADFTFDTFVEGPSNKIAHVASYAVAQAPGNPAYNPLFIYGNSGLGKTHLINSIGHKVKEKNPDAVVLYLSANDFVNDYISSLKNGTIDNFNEKYESIDLLLVDDIQFLAGKTKSNEIFFHIFNHMILNNKQIVITSDRVPQELDGLEQRLISRFAYGMRIGIDTPEFELALAILKKKIELQGNTTKIDEDVLNFMANNYSHDVRQLEGQLNRLLFDSILYKVDKIDMKFALNSFKDDIHVKETHTSITAETIMKTVANYYNLSLTQLISKSRTANIALARHMAMYLIRNLLDMSFVAIGEAFGGRDHSTVMKACDKVEACKKTDPNYQIAIDELKKALS